MLALLYSEAPTVPKTLRVADLLLVVSLLWHNDLLLS